MPLGTRKTVTTSAVVDGWPSGYTDSMRHFMKRVQSKYGVSSRLTSRVFSDPNAFEAHEGDTTFRCGPLNVGGASPVGEQWKKQGGDAVPHKWYMSRRVHVRGTMEETLELRLFVPGGTDRKLFDTTKKQLERFWPADLRASGRG